MLLDWDNLIEKKEKIAITSCQIFLDSPYISKTFELELRFYYLNNQTLEFAKDTFQYIIQNFSKLFERTIVTFAYFNCFKIFYNGNEVLCKIQDFFDLLRWENGGIRVQIDCSHVIDMLARYSFIVDMDYDFCEDGFQFIMQKNQVVVLNTANDYDFIVDYDRNYFGSDTIEKKVLSAKEKMNLDDYK